MSIKLDLINSNVEQKEILSYKSKVDSIHKELKKRSKDIWFNFQI